MVPTATLQQQHVNHNINGIMSKHNTRAQTGKMEDKKPTSSSSSPSLACAGMGAPMQARMQGAWAAAETIPAQFKTVPT